MSGTAPYRLLLVEDNPADVYLIQEALREHCVACEITCLEDGEAALQALFPADETSSFAPDGVILDLNTPKVEGIEVLRRIRQSPSLRHLPVAIVTSSEFPKDKSDAAALGATCYILKSARLEEFFARVGSSIKQMLEQ